MVWVGGGEGKQADYRGQIVMSQMSEMGGELTGEGAEGDDRRGIRGLDVCDSLWWWTAVSHGGNVTFLPRP